MEFKDYIKRFLELIDEEIKNAEDAGDGEEYAGKPVFKPDKDANQYLTVLEKVKQGITRETKEDRFIPFDGKKVNKLECGTREYVNEKLGTTDGQRYITLYFNPKEKKIKSMTTKYGSSIWRKDNPEGEKAKAYGHKIQGLIGDYFKETQQQETTIQDATEKEVTEEPVETGKFKDLVKPS